MIKWDFKCTDVWPQLCNNICEWDNSSAAHRLLDSALIKCDNSSSRPTHLTMGGTSLQLSGTISAIIGEFESLEEVDLSNNKLSGGIPPQLSALSGLVSLNLGNNNLTSTIPAQLSSCLQLTTLDLSYNYLQGPIPSSLGFLTALKVLKLNNNTIVGSTIPVGVPSADFPQSGDCEMGGQCSACSYEACCINAAPDGIAGPGKARDPTCSGKRVKRRDTPMCRVCGFHGTGVCLKYNSCANTTWAKGTCSADCTSSPSPPTPAPPPPAPTPPPTPPPTPSCTGSSSGLNKASCAAWQDLAKATNITGWIECSGALLDPCSCSYGQYEGEGVNCADGDITDMNLFANNLKGTIPSSLASLTKLTFLGLDSNNLKGTIPFSLASLTKLTSLFLSDNSLTGLVPPLPFKQYGDYGCSLDDPDWCDMNCNLFKCPLPAGSEQCKYEGVGVHCK
jgi:hypothetical protein